MSVTELWRIMDKLSKGEITPKLIVNREDFVTAMGGSRECSRDCIV